MSDQPIEGMSAMNIGDTEVAPIAAAQTAISLNATRHFNTRGRSLRGFAARGMLVNSVFDILLQVLSLARGLLIAVFLTRSDYGVWIVLQATIGVLARLKIVGIGDKYMQQDEDDQKLAFQHAFTMEIIVTAFAIVPLVVALPIAAVAYGHWTILLPGLAVILALPATPFTASLWVYYRRLEFVNARMLQALDPVTGFVVTIGLAAAGAGYWALVAGTLAGAWASAAGCVFRSPYPFRWRYDRSVMRLYRSFTWPLLMASLGSVILANSGSLAINAKLGLAGVGVVGLCASITGFSTNVDDIVSGTLYPAICAVQDRIELLRESFEKANRMALMWAMPLGVGLAFFAGDLIRYGLGEKWASASRLLQITGVVVAVGHIGFNWDDYLRARAKTRPVGMSAIVTALAFVAVGVPLTLTYGLRGLGIGIAFQSLVNLGFRIFYIRRRLFPGFPLIRHAARAISLIVPASLWVIAIRVAAHGHHSLTLSGLELAVYVGLTSATIWVVEGPLVQEALGYMFERARAQSA